MLNRYRQWRPQIKTLTYRQKMAQGFSNNLYTLNIEHTWSKLFQFCRKCEIWHRHSRQSRISGKTEVQQSWPGHFHCGFLTGKQPLPRGSKWSQQLWSPGRHISSCLGMTGHGIWRRIGRPDRKTGCRWKGLWRPRRQKTSGPTAIFSKRCGMLQC